MTNNMERFAKNQKSLRKLALEFEQAKEGSK